MCIYTCMRYVHETKKMNTPYFPAKHEVFNKALHAHRTAEYKNHNHPTAQQDQRVGRKKDGVLREHKSLSLFRLAVAVVCCLVFPLWVNNHTSSESKTTFLCFQQPCIHTYTHCAQKEVYLIVDVCCL